MLGKRKARLSAVAVGVALGVVCGAWMLIIAQYAIHGSAPATEMVTRWAAFSPGIAATMTGSFIAAGWGFLKGFFSGLVFSWVYNLCLCCCSKRCGCCCKQPCECKSGACSSK